MAKGGSSDRALIAAFILVGAAVIGGVALLIASRPRPVAITVNPPAPTAEPTAPPPTSTPTPLAVYVTGAVMQPNTVVLVEAGSRVQTVINAAGGAAPDIDYQRVNLAAPVRDGEHLHIASINETPPPNLSAPAQAEPEARSPNAAPAIVNVNTATLDELMTLPRIGEVIGGRIIAYRAANGRFNTLEDLMQVSGIGSATIEGMRGLVSFD